MPLFQTIRTKLGAVVVGIIILSLFVFVFEEALNSNTSLIRGNKDVVGIIDGNKIHYNDFIAKVDETVQNYKLQTNQSNVDDNAMNSIREQTWNTLVSDQLNNAEYSQLGLVVGTEELKDMFFGKDPVQEIRQAFTNPKTGIFDPLAVKNYYAHLDDPPQANEQEGERRLRWVNFEKQEISQRISSKFSDLIKNALYVPKWQAQMDYNERNTRAAVSFVMVPYTSISDSTIKVTDAELQQYINTHAAQYKQDESRKLEYLIFPVNPSKDDTEAVVKAINDVYQKLAAAPNDTNVLKLNSDKGLDPLYYKKDKVESPFVKDTLFKVAVGSLIGPYYENGSYRIAKLMDRKDVPDSVKAHHILLRVQPGADSAVVLKKIDSIFSVIKSGVTPFDTLAKNLSEDKGSGAQGGELGWMHQGQTVPAFNKYLFFEGKPGEMKIVRSEFGYHIIRIDSINGLSPAVQVDFVTRALDASEETDKAAFEKATHFASEYNTAEKFDKACEDQKLNKLQSPTVKKNATSLSGIQSAREIIRWAYEAKLGDVSSPFSADENYVVAAVTGIKNEGTATVNDVRAQVEMLVRKEKKGQQIASQMAPLLSLNSTLDAIASKLNEQVKTSGSVSFSNSYADNLGYEPKVVGTIAAMKDKQMSKPVIGEQGVFVVQVNTVTQPQPIADYNQFKQQLLTQMVPRLQYALPDALKKSVKIEDDRYLFF